MGRAAIFPCLVLLLAGCAPAGPWPSLALRPGEQPRVIAAAAPEPARPPADPAAERAAATALERAAAELAERQRDLAAAVRAARGTAVGSDAWSRAQTALSRHDSAAGGISDARALAEAALDGRSSAALTTLVVRAGALQQAAAERSLAAQTALGG